MEWSKVGMGEGGTRRLVTKNHKASLKEIEDLNKWRFLMFMDYKTKIVERQNSSNQSID